jgi:phage tail protein X
MQYTTKDGDRLDKICARHYGSVHNTVEQVLYDPANDDLTTFDVFPAGVTITLPEIKPAEKEDDVVLWK